MMEESLKQMWTIEEQGLFDLIDIIKVLRKLNRRQLWV